MPARHRGSALIARLSRHHYPHKREISKPSGSGGSTAASLKLKGIDGMTPQGVEYAA